MTKLAILGATALSLSLAIATPVLAQQAHGGRAGAHAAAGAMSRAPMGGGPRAQSNFGAQANVGARGSAQFARSNPQVAQRGEFRGGRDRGFGRGAAFAAGAVATGATIAAGDYGYGYSPDYYGDQYAYGPDYYDYGDSYAFDTGPVVAFEQPGPVVEPAPVGVPDASYCAQRYRSYDPASGSYLGFDGLRHPCP